MSAEVVRVSGVELEGEAAKYIMVVMLLKKILTADELSQTLAQSNVELGEAEQRPELEEYQALAYPLINTATKQRIGSLILQNVG
jgi:hypothetical protein